MSQFPGSSIFLSGFSIHFGFRVSGFGIRVSGLGFRDSGFGIRVSDLCLGGGGYSVTLQHAEEWESPERGAVHQNLPDHGR